MKSIRRFSWQLAVGFVLALGADPDASAATPSKPNVLFIAVDDLNHWVGHLGRNPQAKTPNIDRLARMGVTFTRAYCAAPICNPSRAALLSGRRPGATGIYDNGQPFRLGVTAEESLVFQFRKAGYATLGMGKLWHGGLGFPEQWELQAERKRTPPGKVEDRSIGPIRFGPMDAPDSAVEDTAIADFGIDQLRRKHEKPFFLTLGFHKPHMPWFVPRRYYDLHPLDQIQLPPLRTNDLSDLPPSGVAMAHAMGDHARVLASGRWKEAVQGYLAAISYLDAQLGRVLDAFDESAYATNTIICFWGDHGWHLGEKEHWRKFALWEEATRAPLIWVAPGLSRGGVSDRPVDFMSIYPTLCELAGLPVPGHVEGMSLRKLLVDPGADWTVPAVTTHGFQNHAVRTDRWRYIRYANGDEELYDHANDEFEFTNLARQGGEPASAKKALARWLPNVNRSPLKTERPAPARRPRADAPTRP